MTAEQRKQQIIAFLQSVVWSLTMREVGQGVGLRKTPYLKRILDELVNDGIVLCEWQRERRGDTQYFWLNREVVK